MSSKISTEPRAHQIARQIENDLRGRALAPGDPYLGTDEVAQMFGIHLRTAHRAMEVLAKRNLLVRKRGAGTFVGPAMTSGEQLAGVVHVLVSTARVERGMNEAGLLSALRQHLPGVGVQVNVLPGMGAENDAAAALRLTLDAGVAKGIVLIGCDRPVQDYVSMLGIPAVVFGGTFPTASRLSSIDMDHRRLGQILAECLLRRGHKSLAVMMHDSWLPGDNLFFEGVLEACSLGNAQVVMRSTPIDEASLEIEARQLINQERVITAAICRSRVRYENFSKALQSVRRSTGADANLQDVVFDDEQFQGERETSYACPDVSVSEQIDRLGKLLLQLIRKEESLGSHVVLPVRLVEARH